MHACKTAFERLQALLGLLTVQLPHLLKRSLPLHLGLLPYEVKMHACGVAFESPQPPLLAVHLPQRLQMDLNQEQHLWLIPSLKRLTACLVKKHAYVAAFDCPQGLPDLLTVHLPVLLQMGLTQQLRHLLSRCLDLTQQLTLGLSFCLKRLVAFCCQVAAEAGLMTVFWPWNLFSLYETAWQLAWKCHQLQPEPLS